MNITLEEAKAQLLTVNVAIQDLIAGKRITQLRIGSGNFSRLYVNQEVNLESLVAYRDELLNVINELEKKPMTFRTNAHIPTIVRKGL